MLFPFLFYNLFFSVLLVSLTSRDSQTRKEVNLISLNLPRKSLIRGCHFNFNWKITPHEWNFYIRYQQLSWHSDLDHAHPARLAWWNVFYLCASRWRISTPCPRLFNNSRECVLQLNSAHNLSSNSFPSESSQYNRRRTARPTLRYLCQNREDLQITVWNSSRAVLWIIWNWRTVSVICLPRQWLRVLCEWRFHSPIWWCPRFGNSSQRWTRVCRGARVLLWGNAAVAWQLW